MSKECVIIGAGVAGLTAAQTLREAGWRVTVVDKGRGFGGRLATRRMGEARLDHGAQYFTARDERFRRQVEEWEGEGVVRRWFEEDGAPRYVAVGGMSALARRMAKDLDVRLSSTVAGIRNEGLRWRLEIAEGGELEADALVLTAPAEQSLKLAGTFLTEAEKGQLAGIEYAPCFALMALLPGDGQLPAPGFARPSEGPVAWVADNTRKAGLPGPGALTIHATADFTRAQYEAPPAAVAELLLEAARPWMPDGAREWQLHRWRYALVTKQAETACLVAQSAAPLRVAGDGFGGPRVEGAFLSGRAAGRSLTEI
jgi:predicted NAD/FAD-dependent oxidoreductase